MSLGFPAEKEGMQVFHGDRKVQLLSRSCGRECATGEESFRNGQWGGKGIALL